MEIVSERLMTFVDYLIDSGRVKNGFAFEQACGFYRGFLTNLKRGTGLTDSHMVKISEIFPELDFDWLIKGESSMTRKAPGVDYKKAYEASMEQITALNEIIKELEKE
ncbi:hypothetical protein [Bacteroides reticulotermitis]|nr:hypothetical protein [Bacteroides reticulotermitis]MBB4043795.1 hypothetical protein [Bacteroides reticulotermitis]